MVVSPEKVGGGRIHIAAPSNLAELIAITNCDFLEESVANVLRNDRRGRYRNVNALAKIVRLQVRIFPGKPPEQSFSIRNDAAYRRRIGDDRSSTAALELVQLTLRRKVIHRSMVEHLDMNIIGETTDMRGQLGPFLPRIVSGSEILGIADAASCEGTGPRWTKHHAGNHHGAQDRAPTGFVDAEDHCCVMFADPCPAMQ